MEGVISLRSSDCPQITLHGGKYNRDTASTNSLRAYVRTAGTTLKVLVRQSAGKTIFRPPRLSRIPHGASRLLLRERLLLKLDHPLQQPDNLQGVLAA